LYETTLSPFGEDGENAKNLSCVLMVTFYRGKEYLLEEMNSDGVVFLNILLHSGNPETFIQFLAASYCPLKSVHPGSALINNLTAHSLRLPTAPFEG
jgi:hypothetical protein